MMQRMFTTICDKCGTAADCGYHYSEDAKIAAINEGWKITAKKYTCPDCQ